MSKNWKRGVWTTAVTFALTGPAWALQADVANTSKSQAQTAPTQAPPAASTTPATATAKKADAKTEKLLKDLAKVDMMEVKMGKLGMEKAENPDVQAYAEQLQTDHQAHMDELKTLAESMGVKLDMMMMSSADQGSATMTEDSAMGGSGVESDMKNDTASATQPDTGVNPEANPEDAALNAENQIDELGTGGSGTATVPEQKTGEMKGEMAGHDHQAMMAEMAKKDPELAKHMKEMEKLQKLEGAAFDKEYLKVMVKGHTDAIAKVKAGRKTSKKNPELDAFLAKTQPQLEAHLKTAKSLQKSTMRAGRATPAAR